VLDKALAAASNPSAQTPSSILQQLKQARELHGSDKKASFELVERLLADMDDAQVRLAGAWNCTDLFFECSLMSHDQSQHLCARACVLVCIHVRGLYGSGRWGSVQSMCQTWTMHRWACLLLPRGCDSRGKRRRAHTHGVDVTEQI
jgi:hypothetical protein